MLNIWVNTFLDVFMRVFLDEINIWIIRLRKADGRSQYGRTIFNPLKVWTGKKKRLSKEEFNSLLDFLQVGTLVFWPWTQIQRGICTITSLGFQTSGLRLEIYHWLSWISSLPTAEWRLLSLHNYMSQFLIINFFI